MAESFGNWTRQAACKDDPDRMFVPGAAQNASKRICETCVVKSDCLADALDNRIEYGVWGGMTERQRRALLRRFPQVDSWRNVLQVAARKAGEAARAANEGSRPVEIAGAAGATAIGPEVPDPVQMTPEPPIDGLPDGLPDRDF